MGAVQVGPVHRAVEAVLLPDRVVLPEDFAQRVEAFWHAATAAEPFLFRGPVYSVRQVERSGLEALRLSLAATDYAHYLYGERIGLPTAHACRVLYAAGILCTADDFLVFGEMAPRTAHAGRLQCVAGALDAADLREGVFDLGQSLRREAREEVGIDLEDPALVRLCHPRWLKQGGKSRSLVLVYQIELRLTLQELQAHYEGFVRSLPGGQAAAEFTALVAVPREPGAIGRFLEADPRPQVDYLAPLLRATATAGCAVGPAERR